MSQNSKSFNPEPGCSKADSRALALERRRDLVGKDQLSQVICERFWTQPAFDAADTVLVYMHVRDEVRTDALVARLFKTRKRIVVPYCVGPDLKLFLLCDLDDLSTGVFGIPEPRQSLRSLAERRIEPKELDLLAVPGVAFDRLGGRVGHGRGFFDRLLQHKRADAISLGLAFECQVFERVPMDEDDVPLDGVVTEETAYLAR